MGFLSKLSGRDKLKELYSYALGEGGRLAATGGGTVVLELSQFPMTTHPPQVADAVARHLQENGIHVQHVDVPMSAGAIQPGRTSFDTTVPLGHRNRT
jgi:hypothetical protein